MIDSLTLLCDDYKKFVSRSWDFFVGLTYKIAEPHKSTFQTVIIDDPSFPDLILNCLKLIHTEIRQHTIAAIHNIVIVYPSMKEQFMKVNLVGRMFKTVDFVSLPLSESNTLLELTKFISNMFLPIGGNTEARFEQYPLIRISVFEPAKQFIIFMFNNSDKLILNEEDKALLETVLCWVHRSIKNLELRSDEHGTDFVSELVKWEIRTMVEMENENHFTIRFQSMLNRTWEWNQNKRERQKRREVLLREEGWDDAFEQRVVGIEMGTNQDIQSVARPFRIEMALNADELR
ncbi:hypothetical protein BLNAU_3873 [Blattamonas nauphoetae]|uniref:BACK domain-containing protein n=1 Tax=Blattamonas nauphoetae TaxID=2049346 RepID=A0ABQ9YBH0_9EUKA|nr:hypothetical protein BLNAU_3873 [Blattamonas nauphoetae]